VSYVWGEEGMIKCWFDRRSGQWDSFDANPKVSYYKFLRAVYHMTASEAWERVCQS